MTVGVWKEFQDVYSSETIKDGATSERSDGCWASAGMFSVGVVGEVGNVGVGGMIISTPLNLTLFGTERFCWCVRGKPTSLPPGVPRFAIVSRCWSFSESCSGTSVACRKELGSLGRWRSSGLVTCVGVGMGAGVVVGFASDGAEWGLVTFTGDRKRADGLGS